MEPSLSLSPDDDDEWSRVSSDRQSMLSQDGSSESAITELLVSPERRLWVDAMTLAAARRSPASTLQTQAAFISLFVRGSAGTTALT